MRLTALVLSAVVASSPALSAVVGTKDARIVEVTVYPDRAEAVREARVELPAGASTVEFADLPFTVEPDSLRVSAKGGSVVLGAVEIRDRADDPKETAEQAALREQVKRLEGEIAKLGAEDRVASDLREFLKSLRATTGQRESENLGAGRADPAAIQGVYDLLARKLSELGDQELTRRAAVERLAKDLEVARARLAAARPGGAIRSRVAAVEIDARQAGTLTLRLAYVVSGASWRPSYRGTLDPGTGEVALVSEGVVRQQTGEDWGGVALRLSTASPARGVEPPMLSSLLLRPVERIAYDKLEQSGLRKNAAAGLVNQNVFTSAPEADVPAAVPEEATALESEIVSTGYNVTFEVPGRSDVPADGADHRVVLRQEALPGTLAYRTAPALQPAAYLISVVRTPAQYPLLAGPMRVFMGGAYLGAYALPETAPGAELAIPFGVDNRIKVERVRQPDDRGLEGLGGKTRQIAYELRTSIENSRTEEVTVTLEDRVPVSEDEKIVVEIGKATTPGFKESPRRPGVLLWKLTLAPREKKNVVLAYTVRFPKELWVPGLE